MDGRRELTAFLRVIQEDENLPLEFTLNKSAITIGRHPNNDICLPFTSVSRMHGRIEIREGRFYIIDLDSSNGTYVNGRRATQSTLTDGDILTFGSFEMQFTRESIIEQQKARERGGGTLVEIITTEMLGESQIRSKVDMQFTPLPGAEAESLDPETLVRAHSRLAVLYKLSDILRTVTDEEEMLDRVIRLIFDVLPADRGAVLLTTGNDTMPFLAKVAKKRGAEVAPKEIPVSKTIVERCVSERVAILSSDALSDQRFVTSESVIMQEIRSTMCVPLIVHKKVIGVIYIDTQENIQAFTNDDLAFLTSIANELAISLEHLHLRESIISRERMAAIGETLTNIAHSVKNMLLLSKGGFELMEKSIESGSADSMRESWNIIKNGIDKISTMTQEMLEFTRKRQVVLKQCSINDIIKGITDSMMNEFKKRDIKLIKSLDASLKPRRCDEEGIHKAVLNLVMNAIDAIKHKHGEIRINTQRLSDNSITISITDNGVGIGTENLPKIFYPFFSTKGSAGTGLGLSITKRIIEDMGGQITVESEKNKFTTFSISLPPFDDTTSGNDKI